MAADYKLIQLDGTRIITGQELKDRLTDFVIPALPAYKSQPPKPVQRPDELMAEFDARYVAWFNGVYLPWTAYMNNRTAVKAAFDLTLRSTFKIAYWGKTGQNNPDGTPVYGWTLTMPTAPPYTSFAQKILGYLKPYRAKDLNWICFKTLYT